MQISKKKVSPPLKRKIYDLLYKVIADIRNAAEAKEFLESFLGSNEQEAVARRLGIIYLLKKGKTYNYIKSNLAVSSTTVATIAREAKRGKGFKIALDKIHAEEWADRWAKKISKMFEKRHESKR